MPNSPSGEMLNELHLLVLQTDFTQLIIENPIIGSFAFYVASHILRYADDPSLYEYVHKQLNTYVHFLATENHTDNQQLEYVAMVIVDIVLNLSLANSKSEQQVSMFADVMMEIVGKWNLFAKILRPFMQRICEELPFSQSHQLTRLVMQLRAIS